jgi:hypothetical protein
MGIYENDRIQDVQKYQMTPEEAETFKLALVWEEETKRLFPQERLARLRKSGDPRKCNLYRYCHKLRRETRGLLKREQYRLYVYSQLLIIKRNDGTVNPSMLCGEKAWVRWKIYERWHREKTNLRNNTVTSKAVANPKIMRELDRTKRFIFEQCEGEPTKDKIQGFLKDGKFWMWIMADRISKYYLILSPYLTNEVNSLAKRCEFDPLLFEEKADDAVREFFNEEFSHEFE